MKPRPATQSSAASIPPMLHPRARGPLNPALAKHAKATQMLVESQGHAKALTLNDKSDLFHRQLDFEHKTNYENLMNNMQLIDDMMAAGVGAELRHVIRMMRTWIRPLAKAIEAEQERLAHWPVSSTNESVDEHYGETKSVSEDYHWRYLLLNEFIIPEEIAHLIVNTVMGRTLREGGEGIKFVALCNIVSQEVNAHVYEAQKRARRQRGKKKGKPHKYAAIIDEKDRETLAQKYWPRGPKIWLGAKLVTSVIKVARAPEWWLEAGKRRWEDADDSKWFSDLSMPKKLSRARPTSDAFKKRSWKGVQGNDPLSWGEHCTFSFNNDPLGKGGGYEHSISQVPFGFPMWNPLPERTEEKHVVVFEHNLVAVIKPKKNEMVATYVGKISINPRVRAAIEHVHALSYAPKHLPMLHPPKSWINPKSGGYLTFESDLVRTSDKGGSMQTDALKYANIKSVYKALNSLSEVPWRLNDRVVNIVNTIWSQGGGIAAIPAVEDLPLPTPPPFFDIRDKNPECDPEKAAEIKAHKREYAMTKNENANKHSLRCDLQLKFRVMEQLRGESFYFPYNLDFRGRVYPIPPHYNHLGADVSRGTLLFDEARPLGPNGMRWLKIHLANLCGRDKVSFDEREEWVNENLTKVQAIAADPMSHTDFWIDDADDPFQALATCYEISDAYASGDIMAFESRLPTHQDGSCNGLQHYAALGRDEHGGASVNLLPAGKPQDVYSAVLHLVVEKVDNDAAKGDPLAMKLQGHINRKVVKQTVMTSVYGVTFLGARDQIRNRLREIPAIQWDDDDNSQMSAASAYLARTTLDSISDLFNCAKDIMNWMTECAKRISAAGQPVSWVTPMGLPVVQPYRRSETWVLQTALQTVNMLEKGDHLPVHPTRQKSAFPPNFVHSLDSCHMMMTAIRCREMGLAFASVHDSYWTHAGTMETMNQILREEFVNLYSRPILDDLYDSFCLRYPYVDIPPVPERGDLDLEKVRQSQYFFA